MGNVGVVIVAAGKGSRMRSAVSKQYLLLQNRPIILHTLKVFQAMDELSDIVLVVGSEDIVMVENWVEQYEMNKVKAVVAGGSERQNSVHKGLRELGDHVEWVLIHDGVRPFVTEQAVCRLLEEVRQSEAAVLAVPVKETIKIVESDGYIASTPDRAKLWSIQTPQAFRRELIIASHEEAEAAGFLGTDDAMLVERRGIPVKIVEGDYDNIKITTPEDLPRAELILRRYAT